MGETRTNEHMVMLRIVGMVILLVAGGPSLPAKRSQLHEQRMVDVRQAIEALSHETEPIERADLARKLAALVRELAVDVDSSVAGELAHFLADPQDDVRYWVAMALGYMGPKAESAIPALERALEERKGRDQGKTSAAAIRIALKKIREKPRPPARQPSR